MLVRPRLIDHHGISLAQEEVDFAIPLLEEDIPLYIDPFLLWKSPSQQDNALHTTIINSLNHMGRDYLSRNSTRAVELLVALSECEEIGLGNSPTRCGKRISEKLAAEILSLYELIPQVNRAGFAHFEEIQLYADGIGKDRISDFAGCFLKSFLIDFTIENCIKYNIPRDNARIEIYNCQRHHLQTETISLPVNPISNTPILFVPRRWLRLIPWITFDDYFANHYLKQFPKDRDSKDRIRILEYNRQNYDQVTSYIRARERTASDCRNDPLFSQIPVISAKRRFSKISKVKTGNKEKADKIFEDNACSLVASLMYPHLDLADAQSRTDSGVHIRDLIFYNNRSHEFLKEIYDTYDSRQIVMELKNVQSLESGHVNQLSRYLGEHFGRFGILITRNAAPKSVYRNTIDLWSGQRKCIVVIDDRDLKLMCDLYENKQRDPIDVIRKKYVEFTRKCPS